MTHTDPTYRIKSTDGTNIDGTTHDTEDEAIAAIAERHGWADPVIVRVDREDHLDAYVYESQADADADADDGAHTPRVVEVTD
jgi:hypothetical protein